jgi:ubiquinone/menaquinone biosynthesis C-methylase UbiE
MAQAVLAPGGESAIVWKLQQLAESTSAGTGILDVGCGPASWLWRIKLEPWGLDFTPSYIKKYCAEGRQGVVGAAEALPFPSRHFGTVWSIGLLHHLPDKAASQAVAEMARVCRSDGWVVILDAITPASPWRRPIAHALRRLDRGGFVRAESALSAIIKLGAGKTVIKEKLTYSIYGLELLVTCFQP